MPPSLRPERDFRLTRRFPRYRADFRITVTFFGPQGHQQISGLCNQLGEGGLGAIIGSELTAGEMVDVQLSIPSQPEPLSIRAVVRWRDRLQHGFEFFNLSRSEHEKIKKVCEGLKEM